MKKLVIVLVLVMTAVTGNQQRVAVKTSDLQKSITDRITKDYPGYFISNADHVVANNVTTFEVVITKSYNSVTLAFDKDGKFLNAIALKSGIPERSPGSKSLAHHKHGSKPKADKRSGE